jgi:hypothetical protein
VALTAFQEKVCRLTARNRVANGESYVAGGVALNTLLEAPRLSRDIDLFHDTTEALRQSWAQDHELLSGQGYQVEVVRDAPAYIEALVRGEDDQVMLQWVRDSAFRYFPLVADERLGLTLHPFDLATNKVLALVGRLEIRDWVDVQECSNKIQHLGLLAWAACGKDPGFSPLGILNEAARSSHYTAVELDRLDFSGAPPDLVLLSRQWKTMLASAKELVEILPAEHAGQCLLDAGGRLFNGNIGELVEIMNAKSCIWHKGSLGGVLPQIVE